MPLCVVLDSDGLITLAKAGALERVVESWTCLVPRAVYVEIVERCLEAAYPDAQAIRLALPSAAVLPAARHPRAVTLLRKRSMNSRPSGRRARNVSRRSAQSSGPEIAMLALAADRERMDHNTVYGRFRVDRDGVQIGHQMLLIQWQDGKRVIVCPEELAPNKPRFPTPLWSQRP